LDYILEWNMTSLTQIATASRRIIRYSIFFIIFLMVGRAAFAIGSSIYKKMFPAPPPPPTVAFGSLPAPIFPQRTPLTNLSYTLETTTGELPTLPGQAKVYFMPKASSNLLSLDNAKQKAKNLGFSSPEKKISDSLYDFYTLDTPSTLEMDIITNAFSISYDLQADPSSIGMRPPAGELATSMVRSFLSPAGLLPEDLSGPTTFQYLKIESNKFVPALSLSDSSFVRVYLFRKNYDDYPCLTSEFTKSNVWFMLSGNTDRNKQIIAAEYHYFPVDETKFATYPIVDAQSAFAALQAGNAYISDPGTAVDQATIKIRKVYIAYYDPGVETPFMQPIVVFEGDGGFAAYLPAVTSEYLNSITQTTE